MKKIEKEISVSALKILLKDIPPPFFRELKEKVNTTSLRRLKYTQGDNKDDIWDLLRLGRGYWRSLELLNEHADFMRTLEPFSWYCTLTFRREITLWKVKNLFNRWIREMNEIIVGKQYRKKHMPGIAWVRAVEKQKRGVWHIHALLDHPNIERITKNRVLKIWENIGFQTGKVNRVVEYDSELGACGYLGKVILYNGDIEYSKSITWVNRSNRNITFRVNQTE